MLNFRETEEKKIYTTSDWHLGHAKDFIWKSRGYSSVQEHTDGIINKTNEIVKESDILFNLGDFCLNSSTEQFEEYISHIKCQNVYMLWGNHPNKHYKEIYVPLVKKLLEENYIENREVYPLRYKNIIYMGQYLECILNGQMYIMCHFPFLIWDHQQHGGICLVGHSHSSCTQTNSNGVYGRILDCSWDEFKRPLSLQDINNILVNKRYHPIDHHL